MQLNADMVPIKSLYFEAGSKRSEPGEKHIGLYGRLPIIKWYGGGFLSFHRILTIFDKNCQHMSILWGSLTL